MRPPILHTTQHCYAESVGSAGLTTSALSQDLEKATNRVAALRGAAGDDATFKCIGAASWEDDLADLSRIADDFRGRFDDVVLLGIGGSGLAAKALATALPGRGCRLHVMANLQPGRLEEVLERVDLERTGFLMISKSGSTVEVMAQALIVLPRLEAVVGRSAVADCVLAVAVQGDNPLRTLARSWGFPVLDHPPKVAGRYSVLTLVGMLPALILGLDVAAIRQGAAAVLGASDASEAAALMAGYYRAGRPISVMLAYDERLRWFTQWYAQLWAESLGKAGLGMTPVTALGPVDQHSQLQLYLDGPADKVFTILVPPAQGTGLTVTPEQVAGIAALDYLGGRSIGDIVAASARATVETLVAHKRPVRVITLPAVDEAAMGGLFMHFMLETILTADLLGVNPFDQPAVDEGKVRARDYLKTGRVALEP
ncbi:MAG: glucose-6-phosphate isomerase [Alphaproteobacteria bacterium]